jgi:uncharacterized protein (DUF433 family)
MNSLSRITASPEVMGGKPCIRGLRVTVGMLVGLVASGSSDHEILTLYPYLEPEDIRAALSYAAWRTEEILLFPKLRLGNPAQEALLPDRLCTFAPAPQKQTGSWSFRLENSQAELGNQRSCLVPALPA